MATTRCTVCIGGSILASLSNLPLSLLYYFVFCLSCRFNFVCHVAVRKFTFDLFLLYSLFIFIFTITLISSLILCRPYPFEQEKESPGPHLLCMAWTWKCPVLVEQRLKGLLCMHRAEVDRRPQGYQGWVEGKSGVFDTNPPQERYFAAAFAHCRC